MEKFELRETHAPVGVGGNDSGLTVAERLPKKVGWRCAEEDFALECPDGLVAKFIEPNIFVIEAPYMNRKNRAYVLTVHKKVVVNLPEKIDGASLVYYDILSGADEVFFLAWTSRGDVRCNVDLVTGRICSMQNFR